MRLLKIESYPNREVRVTHVRSHVGRAVSYGSKDETELGWKVVYEPTCHSLKTLNAPKELPSKANTEQGGRVGYGLLARFQKFSTYARRTLLRAGGALESAHPHQECLFLTLTLPGSTKEAMEALARYSGFAVQHLKAWIGKRIKGNLSMYTWEWQKRGALHLHYVVHCPEKQVGEYIQKNLKAQWIRILDAIAKESRVDIYRKSSGFSWESNKEVTRVDCQWCEKSVAAYLSKYVSKASKANHRMPKNAFCPSRWYGVSRPLLALLRSMSQVISLDSIRDWEGWSMYEDCLSILQSWGIRCYEYKHVVGDGKSIVSYVEKEQLETVWNTIMSQTSQPPDLQENIKSSLTKQAQQGIYVMRKSPTWFSTFKQFCANSRPGHLISSPLSKDITAADLAFVLDMLIYTFRYTERTRSSLPGNAQLWYTNTMMVLEAATSSEEESLSTLAKVYKQ